MQSGSVLSGLPLIGRWKQGTCSLVKSSGAPSAHHEINSTPAMDGLSSSRWMLLCGKLRIDHAQIAVQEPQGLAMRVCMPDVF